MRQVYAHNGKFSTIGELKKTISDEWAQISPNVLENIVKSMPATIFEIIQTNGGSTHY